MSKDYIFEPRPVYSSHTPNLFLGSYYIEDDFQADPSMWADPLEDAFVTNSGMKEGKIESVTNLNEFSAETVLMGTNKLDTSEVIPQSYFWKWDNYESHLQIPTQISEDDFESSAYEQFLEVALGYHSDEDPYFLLVVKSFMDEGDDPDIWAEEADWTRIQTTKRWWEIYDQWMDVGGVDFLLDKADDDYDWAMSNAGDLQMIGWEMPLPDDDDFYFRQAENESHWMTFGRVDYNWATDPDDLELADEDFWVIDEQIRNEVRYEIDTNNLPGESNISSSDISLSLTEEDEDDFTIYYYWGSAKTTGVNSAEGFEAETLGKDSCCCGATKSKPCACMATGAKCSGSCACDSAAKKAESFEAEYIHIYDTTITEPEILKKLEGAGIKPTDYYWLTEDIFGLHINSSDADAFQEEFNKKDWTGLYAFDAHGGVRFKRAESDGITRDEKGMRHSPHKKCPDCGAKPTSSWIDPGKCECGRVMNPSEYTNIRFSAFGADEDNFTEIENLLDSNDDIFLGTGDGFKPDHPNREEIIAYLTQGGGGQTPYRVCFTCSRVTPDWVTIDEGYECFPCADQ